jgi:hypothetical protein
VERRVSKMTSITMRIQDLVCIISHFRELNMLPRTLFDVTRNIAVIRDAIQGRNFFLLSARN